MVFFDPLAIHDLDPDCITEERFIAVGMGNMGSLLVVIYTLRGEVIRLISARRATKQERKTGSSVCVMQWTGIIRDVTLI